jgi:hypothetical protein
VPPGLRKLLLTGHVLASVGWFGAVLAFLGLALAGLLSDNAELARSAYVLMEPAGWFVLLPLAVASLATGIAQSLGTRWGLFRHYWVLVKLIINLVATVLLLTYMQTLAHLADAAGDAASPTDLEALRSLSPVLHALLALLLLGIATVLAVYKPRGLTPYGRHAHRREAA